MCARPPPLQDYQLFTTNTLSLSLPLLSLTNYLLLTTLTPLECPLNLSPVVPTASTHHSFSSFTVLLTSILLQHSQCFPSYYSTHQHLFFLPPINSLLLQPKHIQAFSNTLTSLTQVFPPLWSIAPSLSPFLDTLSLTPMLENPKLPPTQTHCITFSTTSFPFSQFSH